MNDAVLPLLRSSSDAHPSSSSDAHFTWQALTDASDLSRELGVAAAEHAANLGTASFGATSAGTAPASTHACRPASDMAMWRRALAASAVASCPGLPATTTATSATLQTDALVVWCEVLTYSCMKSGTCSNDPVA